MNDDEWAEKWKKEWNREAEDAERRMSIIVFILISFVMLGLGVVALYLLLKYC